MKKDKRNFLLDKVDEQLDVRDFYLGVKELKSEYNPKPFNRKGKDGKSVPLNRRAEAAARYLSEEQ